MKKLFFPVCFLFFMQLQAQIKYPTTKKDSQMDDYFGKKIEDPYRWLEDDNSKETGEWVIQQNELTNSYLSKIPYREQIKKRLTDYFLNKNNITKSQAVINWRKRKKQELVEYKGGCCERCGYNKSTRALQFHHLDPNEKDFTISRKSYSIERLKKEVDKCILVCANCHAEIHSKMAL